VKTLSLRLPESLFSRLASAARERGESRSALVREAIESLVAGRGSTPEGSSLDLARDLAGCVHGPKDLSTSSKHMRGYGQ
jgi:hypothetical protein